ncbi:hypothetical protein A3H65_03630 [Candidatus Giovannonibacteria bacterium RIFCSPLOWO2_02_FULL_45_14]|uniref:DNA recombination protein RmuC n=1 Tax=Candidatus Giovannonibacteria bacterium RIFCSPLOWO2_12_FULL_44_15 TaxID=1798364 RepID=A0A1F5Y0C3_9BACT|nr:MAG: hypothetical protein A3C75_03610 [Candidatus Giovannonibacteria bacterium RIFCSPHIGHO2_02_FULL_44_31]OGF76000.1 MAG: hypothetical protein A3E62_01710 [Candidatus Giovannonibacteria bacterium RIFCSPHIGHO2_12_FULL_44_29]OGF90757.1 MAG: hypothetical protein A3H65_03630 [Candidatus Giovannonibacteria bacterium RIFCSPLOWO2_02_FULL_45_14]OGF93658.1 MAG: hypothetical protein A3G54_03925 [Candidatus Giovannonibacteria bacterium RIFCSPLOWO2_12_FULL_44_15]
MPTAVWIILGIAIGGVAAYFIRQLADVRAKRSGEEKPNEGMLMLQNQMNELARKLDRGLGQSTDIIQKQFGESAKIIREVTERLTKLDETNRQVVNFAEQLRKLQDVLQNPKQRGILGEYYLETVLKNVLPPGSFQMQYSFKDGNIVDAAVFVDKRIIPIDSKFSLENYNRILETAGLEEKKKYEKALVNDLKTRIDETSKYVRPQEGTMEFAFMFIPSEAVYYDLLINKVGSVIEDKNLIAYAGQKKVIVVSPTSFLAYLQTVLQGLKNQKISEQAQDIIKQVTSLARHLLTYQDNFQKIGKNLGTTVSAYDKAYQEFSKIDRDIYKITGESIESEPLAIAKPREE